MRSYTYGSIIVILLMGLPFTGSTKESEAQGDEEKYHPISLGLTIGALVGGETAYSFSKTGNSDTYKDSIDYDAGRMVAVDFELKVIDYLRIGAALKYYTVNPKGSNDDTFLVIASRFIGLYPFYHVNEHLRWIAPYVCLEIGYNNLMTGKDAAGNTEDVPGLWIQTGIGFEFIIKHVGFYVQASHQYNKFLDNWNTHLKNSDGKPIEVYIKEYEYTGWELAVGGRYHF